jgi:hypothetical protein
MAALALAEYAGVAVLLRRTADEPVSMAQDRAWLLARMRHFDPLTPVASAERASKLWAWSTRQGCTYADAACTRAIADAARRSHAASNRLACVDDAGNVARHVGKGFGNGGILAGAHAGAHAGVPTGFPTGVPTGVPTGAPAQL